MNRLDEEFDVLVENEIIKLELSPYIKENLKYLPRPYQIESFCRFNYYLNEYKKRRKPTQLLFHMATGSGKSLIMAGCIIELFRKGYNNFMFFVHSDTIIHKTKENFLKVGSPKYLFSEVINIDGENININEVSNFDGVCENEINIMFTTIQKLHSDMTNPKENSVSYEDFTDLDLVLISDEAHHINTLTKKKLTGYELESEKSWENTINRIFNSNSNNILLEFTATIDLHHPAVLSKYEPLLLMDYSLSRFREDGYSKEVKTNQIDYDPIDRALVGILINQYKKMIFSKNGLLIKPVILMKSKTTADSKDIEEEFIYLIKNLNTKKIEDLKQLNNEILKKVFEYYDDIGFSNQNIIDELKDDFSEEKIISINSKNDSEEKQLVINSLEEEDNEYRVVFAVDKLNEGWDVLNLFDIVRLYDGQNTGGANTKIGKTTMAEAQLIGRGARYCPFKLNEQDDLYKRKFDKDLENEMRICETLHYHCSHNPRYISELTNALKEIGLIATENTEVDLLMKEDFKETNLYKSGFIYLNKKVENNPTVFSQYQEPQINKIYTYNIRTNYSIDTVIFEEEIKSTKPQTVKEKEYLINTWGNTVILKGLNSIPFYHFNKLKRIFPSINSIDDFISNDKYLGKIKVKIRGNEDDIQDVSPHIQLKVIKSILKEISNEINTKFGDYRGTKSFYRKPIRQIFKSNKKLYFSLDKGKDAETGKSTLRYDIDPKYYVNLTEKDWYVYTDNFGTSEEKFLVKYIDNIHDSLSQNFEDIYLLRNERFFKIYRFSDGKATEPDFVMFLSDKGSEDTMIYQLFIEPKGDHLLETDQWKEDFLGEIDKESVVELFKDQNYRLIGMPFYNEKIRKPIFEEKVKELIEKSI